jgi:hypothetical protein
MPLGKIDKGKVGRIRGSLGSIQSPHGIESPDEERVSLECFGGCDVLNPMLFPQAI